jgi:hypothetical protein
MHEKEILLRFDNKLSFTEKGKHVRDGLSAALRTGNNLWLCCDERSSLERLTLQDDGSFGNHTHFDLNEYLSLPESDSGEIDIEGIGLDENRYLWVVGSHSLARKKPRKTDPPEKQIKRLAKLKDDAKRYLLARIPLIPDADGTNFGLCKSCTHPHEPGKNITAAQLISAENGNQLMEVLSADEHIKKFLHIPGKDNGFDIEGLACYKGRIFIGIRGPVLRGWAIILEVQIEDTTKGYFKLKPDSKGRLYKKHFLHMEGMGVRELRVSGNDLLVLAGPTMDLDGTIAVYRWQDALLQTDQAIVHRKELHRLFDIPHGHGETTGQDKAEGMALYDKDYVLIVFDSPTDARKPNESDVVADLYRL